MKRTPPNPTTGVTEGKLRTLLKSNLRPIWPSLATFMAVFLAVFLAIHIHRKQIEHDEWYEAACQWREIEREEEAKEREERAEREMRDFLYSLQRERAAAKLEASKTTDDCHLSDPHLKSECRFVYYKISSDLRSEIVRKEREITEISAVRSVVDARFMEKMRGIRIESEMNERNDEYTRDRARGGIRLLKEAYIAGVANDRRELDSMLSRINSSKENLTKAMDQLTDETAHTMTRADAGVYLDAIRKAERTTHWPRLNGRFHGIMWQIRPKIKDHP